MLVEFAAIKIHNDESNFLVSLMAIRTLGQWGESRPVDTLINFFINEMNDNDENYRYSCRRNNRYFVDIGVQSVDPLLKVLENRDFFDSNLEYLLKLYRISKGSQN
jgi:hypothetical protein